MENLKAILEAISIWIIVLPLITGLWCIKKMHHNSIIVFVLVVIAAIPQLLPESTYNTPVFFLTYNIYSIVEFVLLFLLFYRNYFSRIIKWICTSSLVAYFIIAMYYLLVFSFSKDFINQLACVNNLFYVFWIILYAIELQKNDESKYENNASYNYYMVGVLQYAACSTIILSLYHLKKMNPLLNSLWIFQSLPNIAMYLLFSFGFFIDAKKQKL